MRSPVAAALKAWNIIGGFARVTLLLAFLAGGALLAQRTVTLSVPANQMNGSGSATVVLTSVGGENALGFSVTFDPAVLRFDSTANGADLGGATVNVNSSQLASGRLGIALALPSDAVYATGSRALVVVNFTVLAAARTNTPLGFGDTPVFREVSDARANALPTSFTGVTIAAGPNLVSPSIVTSPAGATVTAGATATLTVVASGSAPLTYQWRKDGVAIPGATGASLALPNISASAAGTYTVVVSNGAGSITSSGATVVVNVAPVAPTIVTAPQDVTAPAGTTVTLSVVANGTGPLAYQWLKNGTAVADATNASLTIAGSAANAGTYAVRVSNAGGSVTSSAARVEFVSVPVATFAITQAPASQVVLAGGSATFSVGVFVPAGATAPTYRWFKDGTVIPAATSPELGLAAVGPANDGGYVAELTAGNTTTRTDAARLTVVDRPAPPTISRQPSAAAALAGATVSFTVAATGNPAPTYQWRRNGTAMAGATQSSFILAGVQPGDAAGYDVVVSNGAGATLSSLAPLMVPTAATLPVITEQPADVALLAGRSVRLRIDAIAAPEPSFQWRKNGVALAGAIARELVVNGTGPAEAGAYSVEVRNSAGVAVSREAMVRVLSRSYGGIYHGTLPGGRFALYIRPDNTGVLLGNMAAPRRQFLERTIGVGEDGSFHFPASGWPGGDAATPPTTFDGRINDAGVIAGTLTGGVSGSFSGTKAGENGATATVAGLYELTAAGSASEVFVIVGPAGRAYALARAGAATDAGEGSADAVRGVNVVTDGQTNVVLTSSPESGGATGTLQVAGNAPVAVSGYKETATAAAEQRVANISTRVRVGTAAADSVAIVGFVIDGTESKPVLIRAVGPTLRSFGVSTGLAATRLEIVRDGTTLASNAGWAAAANADQIAAASVRAGAFPLATTSPDAAVLAVLSPGVYSAIASAPDRTAGIALVEVYDLAAASPAQNLVNISTRASSGTGEAILIGGITVTGSSPKRVLVRAAGPALTQFGVANALARPVLRVFAGESVMAENSDWSVGPDAAAIAEESARVGAFAFARASNDAAILINLPPGSYTAQVSPADGTPGVALLEVYEVP